MGVNITYAHDFKGEHPKLLVSWELDHNINLLPKALIFLSQSHHFLPIEWLKIPAQVAENSGFEPELYHSSGHPLSNPTDPISTLYPGELSCVASINQGLYCLLGAGWVWPMGGTKGADTGWMRVYFISPAPSSVDLMFAVAISFGVGPLLPQDSLWVLTRWSEPFINLPPRLCLNERERWLMLTVWHCVNDFSPSKELSYLCLNFSLVSSQGCMGKWLIT